MRVLARILAVGVVVLALAGCGRCEAGGDRRAQDALCRIFGTNF